jgi:hypothetical protein
VISYSVLGSEQESNSYFTMIASDVNLLHVYIFE